MATLVAVSDDIQFTFKEHIELVQYCNTIN